jgi:hypothetical protein
MGMRDAIPVIFAATLLQELKDELVFGKIATQKHSGEIKEKGDRIKLKGYGGVEIDDYAPENAEWKISHPAGIIYHEPEAAAIFLDIDQAKDYGIKLHDITELQSDPAARQHYAEEAGVGLKEEVDKFIASLFKQSALGTHVLKHSAMTTKLITSYIGELWEALKSANVKKKWVVIPPWVALKLLLAGIIHADDLKGELKNGFIGRILQFDIYMSNNCKVETPVTPGYKRNIVMAGSYQAIAFADQMTEAESLRSQGYFADLVRGLHVWGARVVKPKELFYLDLEFAPEDSI